MFISPATRPSERPIGAKCLPCAYPFRWAGTPGPSHVWVSASSPRPVGRDLLWTCLRIGLLRAPGLRPAEVKHPETLASSFGASVFRLACRQATAPAGNLADRTFVEVLAADGSLSYCSPTSFLRSLVSLSCCCLPSLLVFGCFVARLLVSCAGRGACSAILPTVLRLQITDLCLLTPS